MDEIYRWPLTYFDEYIYALFEGMVFQQIVGIPMGTNCVPLWIFFYIVIRGILCLTFTNLKSMTS